MILFHRATVWFLIVSAPLQFAAGSPAGIEKPALWLVADDLAARHRDNQAVLAWPDRSGNGFDAVYEGRVPQAGLAVGLHNPPTFSVRGPGGHGAVAFDAALRHTLVLNRAGLALGQKTSGFSAAFVVRPELTYGHAPAPGASWTKNRYLFLTHISNYNTRVSVQIVEDSGEVKLFSRPVPAQVKVTQNSSFDGAERRSVTGGAWNRLLVTVDYQAKIARIVINGVVLVRALPRDSADAFEDLPGPVTGIGSTTLGDWLTCQIAELACYDRALSVDEIAALDAYLKTQYRLN